MTTDDDRRQNAALDATLRQLGAAIVPVEDSEQAVTRRARIVPELSAYADRVFAAAPRRSVRRTFALAALVLAASLGIVGFRLLRGVREVASAAPSPTIRASEGPVRIFHGGRATGEDERAPTALGARDRIETGAGHAEVSLATGALVELDRESELELGGVVRAEGALSERINLGEGRIHVHVPKLPPGGRLTIGTPQATVTVHGTAFIVDVRKASPAARATTTVSVSEGRVSVESGGREIFLGPGSQWTSSSGGATETVSSGIAPAPSAGGASTPRATAVTAPRSTLGEENELFRSAMASRRAGDPKAAVELLDRLLTTYPTTPLGTEARAERDRARAELAGESTAVNIAALGVLGTALGLVLGTGCTTSDTGSIDLVASAAPPHAPPPCAADQDCPKPSPLCSPALRCVQCLGTPDCKDPKKPVCLTPAGTCVECASNLDCASDPARMLCDVSSGHCVGCIGDAGCKAGEQCAPDGVCRP